MIRKIVTIVLFIIILLNVSCVFYLKYQINNQHKLINTINKESKNLDTEKEKIVSETENYNSEMNELKENNKNEMDELDIWNQTKENLEQALSY